MLNSEVCCAFCNVAIETIIYIILELGNKKIYECPLINVKAHTQIT
jgi:hypothetical protein